VPSIYDIKPAFQGLLRPITRSLAGAGVTANQATVFACLLSVGTGIFLGYEQLSRNILWIVPVIMLVRMALNAIDGMLAREHGMKSNLGAILNELTDVISDTFLYLPFSFLTNYRLDAREFAYVIVPLVILSILSEMTGVVAIQAGAARRYDGPMGKSDRAFVFGAVSLALTFGVPFGDWLFYFFGVVDLLIVLTIFNRARNALRQVA
jgi:CDP-diacylglycerol--glycerol-3-phosphate 3-phosphatidyltransferase